MEKKIFTNFKLKSFPFLDPLVGSLGLYELSKKIVCFQEVGRKVVT